MYLIHYAVTVTSFNLHVRYVVTQKRKTCSMSGKCDKLINFRNVF